MLPARSLVPSCSTSVSRAFSYAAGARPAPSTVHARQHNDEKVDAITQRVLRAALFAQQQPPQSSDNYLSSFPDHGFRPTPTREADKHPVAINPARQAAFVEKKQVQREGTWSFWDARRARQRSAGAKHVRGSRGFMTSADQLPESATWDDVLGTPEYGSLSATALAKGKARGKAKQPAAAVPAHELGPGSLLGYRRYVLFFSFSFVVLVY